MHVIGHMGHCIYSDVSDGFFFIKHVLDWEQILSVIKDEQICSFSFLLIFGYRTRIQVKNITTIDLQYNHTKQFLCVMKLQINSFEKKTLGPQQISASPSLIQFAIILIALIQELL